MSTGCFNKLCRAIAITCAAALMGVGLAPPAFAAHNAGLDLFELDRNTPDNNVPGEDWNTVLIPGYAGTGTTTVVEPPQTPVPGFPGVLGDPGRASGGSNVNDATIFTGGGSKDVNDISQWKFTDGSIPDKDDITNAYAVAYQKDVGDPAGDHLIVYFGADRFAQNGDAQIGFWFFQQDVRLSGGKFVNGPNGPVATHTDGDLLILADFTQGGTVGTIKVYEWFNGALSTNPISNITTGDCSLLGPIADHACAVVNTSNTTLIWPYQSKTEGAGIVPQGGFFEGGIDVTAVFQALGQTTPCFASFLAETRSSQSPTAQLKDFVLGGFPLCGVGIVKNCSPLDPDQNLRGGATFDPDNSTTPIHYVFKSKVENTGSGTIYGVQIKEEQIFSTADPGQCTLTKVDATDITDIPLVAFGTTPDWVAVPGLETLGAGQSKYLTIECDSKVRQKINIINVRAKSSPSSGAAFNVGPEQYPMSASQTCDITVTTGVTIAKGCTDLNMLNGVTPEVCVDITVRNTSSQDFKITTLTDTHPGSDPTAVLQLFKTANGGSDTLQQAGKVDGQGNFLDRITFNHCYQPTSGSGGPDPGNVFYPDTAHVEGAGVFDGATSEDTKEATCFLCPPLIR